MRRICVGAVDDTLGLDAATRCGQKVGIVCPWRFRYRCHWSLCLNGQAIWVGCEQMVKYFGHKSVRPDRDGGFVYDSTNNIQKAIFLGLNFWSASSKFKESLGSRKTTHLLGFLPADEPMVAFSLREFTLKHFDRSFVVFPDVLVHDASYSGDGPYFACLLDVLGKSSNHRLHALDIPQAKTRDLARLIHAVGCSYVGELVAHG